MMRPVDGLLSTAGVKSPGEQSGLFLFVATVHTTVVLALRRPARVVGVIAFVTRT